MAHEKLQVTLSLGFALITMIGWLAMILRSDGWIKRVTVFYTIDAGLNTVKVSPGVVSAGLSPLVGRLNPKVEQALSALQKRTFGMQEFREYMCQLPILDGCGIWGNVQHSSWFFMIVIFLSMIAFGFGVAIDYYYHFVRARKSQRKWVRMLYLCSPLANMLGLLQYCLLAAEVNNMQPVDKSNPLGPNVWISCVLLVCNWVPFWAVYTLGGDNLAEDINEEESALNKHKKEDAINAYGAMGFQSSGAAPGQAALQEAGRAHGPHDFQQTQGHFVQQPQQVQSFQGGWATTPPPNQQGFQGAWASPDPSQGQQGFQGGWAASPDPHSHGFQAPQQFSPGTFQEQPPPQTPPQSMPFSAKAGMGSPAF